MRNNYFEKLVNYKKKVYHIETGLKKLRDALKVINIKGLKEINQHIVKRAFENKVFEKGTIDGHTVVEIDGTKFFGSNKKSCTECVKNNHFAL